MANKEKWKAGDELDQALDETLARYASEPRVGLEERVLASVRAAEVRVGHRAWWTWGFAAALTAALLAAGVFAWRSSKPVRPEIVKRPSSTQQTPASPESAKVEGTNSPQKKEPPHKLVRHSLPHETVAANPKLDVFPSPLPLSEQEKILASYVAQYPEHAALVAEARMDALRYEAEQRRRLAEQDQKQ